MKQCKYCNNYSRVGFDTCFGHAHFEKSSKKSSETAQGDTKSKKTPKKKRK